jgi:NADH-quinone oxidoreductase subunit N
MMPSLLALMPMLVIGFGALALMLAEVVTEAKTGLSIGTAVVLLAGGVFAAAGWLAGPAGLGDPGVFAPWLVFDKFTLFFEMLLAFGGALAALVAGGYLREHGLDRGEFYAILSFSTLGAMMLAAAGDVLMLFVGLETMSLGAYALAGFRRGSPKSIEGALKYFLLGSFAAALMLFGFALLYGVTGHTDLAGLRDGVAAEGARSPGVVVALVLILAGLVFKVSAVPFHMWTPDAYEGAPTPATAFMAASVKAGGFAVLVRVLLTVFGDERSASWATGWPPVVALLAVLTMTVANMVAGRQESVKRMLAYSSVAHAGYLLVGVVAAIRAPEQATSAVLFYLATYTVSTIGAFASLVLCGSRGAEVVSYEDLAGLGRRNPAVALPLAFFTLSLAGMPPMAGFFGKWFVFKAAMDAGLHVLTILAFVNSVIGAYYYLKVLVFLYMREPAAGAPVAKPMWSGEVATAIAVSALLVLILGLTPGSVLDAALAVGSAG